MNYIPIGAEKEIKYLKHKSCSKVNSGPEYNYYDSIEHSNFESAIENLSSLNYVKISRSVTKPCSSVRQPAKGLSKGQFHFKHN